MIQVKASLPDDLRAALKLRAEQEGISESAIIRRALMRDLQIQSPPKVAA